MNCQKLLLSIFGYALVVLLVVACSSTSTTPEVSVSSQVTTSAPEASTATPIPGAKTPPDTPTPVVPTSTPTPSLIPTPTISPLAISALELHDLNYRIQEGFVSVFAADNESQLREVIPILENLRQDLTSFRPLDGNKALQSVQEKGLEFVDKLLEACTEPSFMTLHGVVTAMQEYDAAFANLSSEVETPPADTSIDLGSGQFLMTIEQDGERDIWVMNVDGTELNKLVDKNAWDPVWSPDERLVAFESSTEDDNSYDDIFLFDTDGMQVTNLTADEASDASPDWSPDGARIVFSSNADTEEGHDIYIVKIDGTDRANLTNNSAYDTDPAWSPNGEQIAFVSERDSNQEVYVMNVDGTGVTNLTNDQAADRSPAWSPDGEQIAFVSERDGNPEIYVMSADGTNVTRLTRDSHRAFDNDPVWSPDGSWILFTSNRFFNDDIFAVSPDGSVGPIRLTDTQDGERISDWRP